MKYDIYFHDDLDGRASAAVMLHFLEGRGDRVAKFIPLEHRLRPEWLKETFLTKKNNLGGGTNPAVVLDFLYHPQAAFWIDHHATTFKKESWRKNYKKNAKLHELHDWKPLALSCTHQTIEALVKHFNYKPPRHFRELAKWLDVIDAARFSSAKQALSLEEPAFQINSIVDHYPYNPKENGEALIRLLAYFPLAEVAKNKLLAPKIAFLRKDRTEKIVACRHYMHLEGKVAVTDPADEVKSDLRFAAYAIYPQCTYSVIFKARGSDFHIGAGVNPWHKPHGKAHLGKLLQKYGGGGHKMAAGLELPSEKKARQALREIIDYLNSKHG